MRLETNNSLQSRVLIQFSRTSLFKISGLISFIDILLCSGTKIKKVIIQIEIMIKKDPKVKAEILLKRCMPAIINCPIIKGSTTKETFLVYLSCQSLRFFCSKNRKLGYMTSCTSQIKTSVPMSNRSRIKVMLIGRNGSLIFLRSRPKKSIMDEQLSI